MIIGIDFDNTLVDYNSLFYKIALEKNLISNNIKENKEDVKRYLRNTNQEHIWTELQGEVYGPRIFEAKLFPNVLDFFKYCLDQKIDIHIISHKTRHPFIGPKYDLHNFAREFIKKQDFYKLGFSEKNIFFQLTKEDKLKKIGDLKCDYFIDDLPEFLSSKEFPKKTKQILFDPSNNHENEPFEKIRSWNEMIEKIKFEKKITELLIENGYSNYFKLDQINSGKNNKVFLLNFQNNKENFLLKSYFHHPEDSRNRLNNEFSFLTYAWNIGIRNIAKPLICDKETNIGLYQFIKGRKITQDEINKELIKETLNFLNKLNLYKNSQEAKKIPPASDACFNINQHLNLVEKRINKLKGVESSSEINKKMQDFLNNKIIKIWNELKDFLQESLVQKKISLTENISEQEKCISPSDLGFHNAIMNSDQKIFFIDFEYSGWDDPIKMICDFFCQPEIPVSFKYYQYFIDNISLNEKQIQLIDLILPVHIIKWCCIILNEFLEVDGIRRQFAQQNTDLEKEKEKQLKKAIEYLETKQFLLKRFIKENT